MRVPKGGIAFFDSGLGGLTVLFACEKYFPNGVFYYYGDNTHAPYGNLPPAKIKKYTIKAFKKFKKLQVSAAVVACNTATAVCIEELRKRFSFPIIGTEPAVALAAVHGGEIWVLTTRATFHSERFQNLCARMRKCFPAAQIILKPCDALAGEIEGHLFEESYDYTPFLPSGRPTAVVLGCTHYIYIEEQIHAHYQCPVYHGNEGVASRLLTVFEEKQRKNRDERPPKEKHVEFLGFLTTFLCVFSTNRLKRTNANKSSCLNTHNPAKNQGKTQIIFLGKGRKKNEETYRKTYVCKFFG